MLLRRLAVALLLVVYLAAVAASVFGASPDRLLNEGAEKSRRLEAAAVAAANGDRSVAALRSAPTRELVPALDAEEVGNVLMFVPFGLLFPVAVPRLRRWTIPVGVSLSAGIELVQRMFLPWRSPTVNDIVWNSLGAAIGFSLWLLMRSAYRLVAVPR